MTAAVAPQTQLQQQQQQQPAVTHHERYIPPPLDILPEQQEHTLQQHSYQANVFTTPGTVTAATAGPVAGASEHQQQQHVGGAVSTNGIFENGKVRMKKKKTSLQGLLCSVSYFFFVLRGKIISSLSLAT